MIDGLPLSFFLPLVVHALAALTTGVTGVITFSRPKRRGRHPKWGGRYLWAYTVVFLTTIILSVQHWSEDERAASGQARDAALARADRSHHVQHARPPTGRE